MNRGLQRGGAWLASTASVLAISVVLTACSSTPEEPSEGDGGTLVVGISTDLDNIFPWKSTDRFTVPFLTTIYDTLVQFDDELNVVPGLAESFEVSEDGLTVTFVLQEDLHFSDGTVLDSADVKFSYDAVMDEATAAIARTSMSSVESVEAPDPRTVVLNLTSPNSALLASLASVNLAILSSEDTESDLLLTTNGSGPFALEEWVPNESVVLKRNESYWGSKPPLDSIEFRVIPDEASIVAALKAGSVQFAVLRDKLNVDTLSGSSVDVSATPELAVYVLQFNASAAPVNDVNLRLAISCAIDRQDVIDTAAFGAGQVSGPITSPAFRSDPEDRPCPTRDLDKARDYLSKSAYPNGVSFEVMTQESPVYVNATQNIKAQLAEIGVDIEIAATELGTFIDRWVAADFAGVVTRNGGQPDPDTSYGRYFTSTGNLNKVAGYQSDELDRLFALGKQTSDVTERKEIYAEISRELEDEATWVWLYTGYMYVATADSVQGFVPMANESLQNLRVTSLR